MADLQANLDEVKAHEKEARALLAQPRREAKPNVKTTPTSPQPRHRNTIAAGDTP